MKLNVTKLGVLADEIKRLTENGTVAGAACNVYLHDQKVYETYLGRADEAGNPINERSIFHMASTTKAVTAVAILQLAEAGKLSLDDPVSRYIPAFADTPIGEYDADGRLTGTRPNPTPITILHCLTHSAGIFSSGNSQKQFESVRIRAGERLSDFVPRYAAVPLDFEPGSCTRYSPVAAPDVLACIAEMVSGEEYRSYLYRHITEPLGMPDTRYDLSPEQQSRIVTAFHTDSERGIAVPAPLPLAELFTDLPFLISGGGGLCSTLPDFTRFVRMLARGGELDGARILSERSVRRMTSPACSVSLPGMASGYVWGNLVRIVIRNDLPRCSPLPIGSTTWSGAWGLHFVLVPELDLCGMFMASSKENGGAGSILDQTYEKAIMSCVE